MNPCDRVTPPPLTRPPSPRASAPPSPVPARQRWLQCSSLLVLLACGGLLVAAPPDRAAKNAELGLRTGTGLRKAQALATKHGLPIAGVTPGGAAYHLIRAESGRVVFYQTLSANAAITTNTHIVRNTAPYNVDGTGFTVGVWDAGWIRTTHEALTPRVTIGDGNFIYDPVGTGHATSVTGVIAASLIAPANYIGMAPSVNILGFDSVDDLVEMAAAGAAIPNDPGKVYLSNHAYGILCGWEFGNYSGVNAYHFFGDWPGTPLTESNNFGIYLQDEVDLDDICFDLPYYLPVISAGNDRDDAKPSTGQSFYYYFYDGVNFPWYLVPAYDPGLHPGADGVVNSGFDTIQPFSGAKNTLCVGAINDGQFGGARDLAYASMSSFSGWGPMDDGRIKPDLVGNGVGLYGLRAVADTGATTAYRAANDLNGTSFSAPNVTGSAVLLHQLYSNLFSGQVMRASTLKALLIHTADDITSSTGSGHPSARVGPDYSTGWGVMNTRVAADLLLDASTIPSTKRLFEEALDAGNPSREHLFESDGLSPIRVTICWTDPPGTAKTALDDRTPVLVNDLDLRITGPGGSPTYLPYILDVENPANAATTGDNLVDNVEQILISTPAAGTYAITVTHKATLSGGSQAYALLQSGLTGEGNARAHDWMGLQEE